MMKYGSSIQNDQECKRIKYWGQHNVAVISWRLHLFSPYKLRKLKHAFSTPQPHPQTFFFQIYRDFDRSWVMCKRLLCVKWHVQIVLKKSVNNPHGSSKTWSPHSTMFFFHCSNCCVCGSGFYNSLPMSMQVISVFTCCKCVFLTCLVRQMHTRILVVKFWEWHSVCFNKLVDAPIGPIMLQFET